MSGVRAPSLAVAAAQPACRAGDVAGNAEVHARVVPATQARVVVFPELSLTGYELDAVPVAGDQDVLIPIIDACAAAGSLALWAPPSRSRDGASS
jgi:predicted amidohydrolase